MAVIGPIYFCLVAEFLYISPFASRRNFEGLVRFILVEEHRENIDRVQELFSQLTGSASMVAMREAIQGGAMEYSYQVRLLDPSGRTDLIAGLEALEGVEEVSMVMQRSTVEI